MVSNQVPNWQLCVHASVKEPILLEGKRLLEKFGHCLIDLPLFLELQLH